MHCLTKQQEAEVKLLYDSVNVSHLIIVSGAGGSMKSKCTRSSIPSFSSVSTTVS